MSRRKRRHYLRRSHSSESRAFRRYHTRRHGHQCRRRTCFSGLRNSKYCCRRQCCQKISQHNGCKVTHFSPMHEISRFPEKIILFTMALGQETLTVCAKISNFALMNSSLSSSACAGSAAGSADRQPTLYLLPVPLSDVDPAEVMPPVNIEIARSVRHFIVENIRSARRFLKRCDRSIDIDSLTFDVLDEHTRSADVAAMLAPMERGEDMAVVSEAGCVRLWDRQVSCSPSWRLDSTARHSHLPVIFLSNRRHAHPV